jgi:hypothetical protein
MALVKNRSTEQNRRFWSHVEEIARETDALTCRDPQQARGEPQREEPNPGHDENGARRDD